MPPVSVRVPDLGPAPARLSLWHVGVGDRVYEGDRLAEVVLPGAAVDIPAPATGVVRTRLVVPNDPVRVGQVVGTIEPEE